MFGSDRGWQGKATWTRLVIAAFVLSLGVGTARAESAKQEQPTAAAKPAKKAKGAPKAKKAAKEEGTAGREKARGGPPSSAYIPIEKPDGTQIMPMRRTSMSDRMNAGIRLYERRQAAKAAEKAKGGPALEPSGGSGLRSALTAVMRLAIAQTAPTYPQPLDLWNFPNWAYSKLPIASCSVSGNACMKDADCPGYKPPILVGINIFPGGETCTGPVKSGGIRKFVDSLAPLCPVKSLFPAAPGGISKCLPVATPDTTTYPGADYYELGLKDYTYQFHSDLPATTQVRGYYQKNVPASPAFGPEAGTNSYLGPIIVAQSYRPVRMKLFNELPPATLPQLLARSQTTAAPGDLFIPTDTVVEGAGFGPTGNPFSNNRATVHLHGGNTPWIADGTQHQWIAPIGQTVAGSGNAIRGWSVQDIPDMWFDSNGNIVQGTPTCDATGANCVMNVNSTSVPVSNYPGDGLQTYYWTNQQSGRLMFYHDHAYGITRLNVYAGEAAGYLLVNPPDEDALAAATVPGTIGSKFFDPATTVSTATGADLAHMIPLVIQDKTFVPPMAPPPGTTLEAQLAQQDPSWNPALWGGEGNLWYPHIYVPNQWPDNPDKSATNPFGRWDYGPWFWPAQTALAETGFDGITKPRPLFKNCLTAVPGMPPSQIDAVTGLPYNTQCPTTPDELTPSGVSMVPESFLDTPVINGVAYPTLNVEPAAYRFQILNAAQERNWNLSWFVADATGKDVAMVPAIQHGTIGNTTTASTTPPLCSPGVALSRVTGLPFGPDLQGVPVCWPATWPTDNRQGGVPDPTNAGPQWIQIGSEAGLLPAPAFIPPTPVGFEQNKRNIVVLNVSTKGLFMGPAERADVIVDFSAYAGKTLILYNDAPAPVPAGDTRVDTYTGDPDQTLSGGPPTTLPGYGPNIRTIMQVNVAAAKTSAQPALDQTALMTAVGQRFKLSQPAPIVPESAYNPLYQPPAPAPAYTDTYLPIQAVATMTFTPIATDAQGNVCNGTNCPLATPGTYTIQNKALHELFTTNYGRMNSLLGTEIPLTNWTVQTTIPFSNFDPASDFLTDGQIQIWKVTHNGVDTHTIHFHLVNVQIVNRVGWDGQVRPPDANELGWKEAVRMNPLEDVYLAVRPVKQNLPWPLPDKWRPMDVVRQLGADTAFTGVDIFNQPIAVPNQMQNYGWEYVWHCHLLGHEEEDMLRAEVFVVAPEAPSNLSASQSTSGVGLSWTENSKSTGMFHVQRSTDVSFPLDPVTGKVVAAAGTDFMVNPAIAPPGAQVPGTLIVWSDPDAGTLNGGTTYFYRVRAEKTLSSPAVKDVQGGPLSVFSASSAWSNLAQLGLALSVTVQPNPVQFPDQLVNTTSTAQIVTITAGQGAGTVGLAISLAGANASNFAQTNNCPAALNASQSCTVNLTFTPSATGARAATLVVTTSNPSTPTINVPVTGNGIAPVATVTPVALAFGNQMVKTISAAQTVTVQNTGTAPLTVTGATFAGVNAADFAVASNTCPVPPATLPINASCAIGVTFTPAATGARSGRLVIASNDPVSPSVTVALSGTGIAPIAGVSPASLTFSNQLLKTTSAAQSVTVTNTGTGPLTVNGVTLGGANAADYAIVSNLCTTVAVGGNCTFGVTFTPSGTTNPRVATVTVNSNDPVNPNLTVALSGTVIYPTASASPSSLTYALQLVGTTSSAQTVTLSNLGALPSDTLTIASITPSGDYAIASSTCGASLAGGASCAISVTFSPTAAGARPGTLLISTSDPLTPITTVVLNGTGTAIKVAPTSLVFAAQLVGTMSATQTVTITNTGSAGVTPSAPTVTGTNAGDYTVVTNTCTGTIAGGASCAISIRFSPLAAGASSATLSVVTSDPGSPSTVALSGTGAMPIATPSPAALSFSAAMGTTSAPQVVTVTNTGTAPLTVTSIQLNGVDANQFAQTNNCVGTFAAGASCQITVRFSPNFFGGSLTKSASIRINASAPAASPDIPLAGTVLVATYTMTPNALVFAKQAVGTTSAAQVITVTNSSTVALGIRGVSLGGANPGSFAQTNNCPALLAAGSNCTINVTFTPTRTGNRTATLTLRAQQPATSTSVPLSGTGQ